MSPRKIAGLLIMSLFMGGSFSAYAAGPSGNRAVTYIEVLADGGVLIEGATAFNNPDGCSNPGRIIIQPQNQFINRYYAAALTAYSTNNNIWAWLSGCWTAPWGAVYPIVVNAATRVAP